MSEENVVSTGTMANFSWKIHKRFNLEACFGEVNKNEKVKTLIKFDIKNYDTLQKINHGSDVCFFFCLRDFRFKLYNLLKLFINNF